MPNADIVVEDIPDADFDPNHPATVAIAAFQARSVKAKKNAVAMHKAAESWPLVKSDSDWGHVVEQATEDYRDGSFLIAQLGGAVALDAPLMATLLTLRDSIIEELGITMTHELMMLDVALLSYRNFLRIQNWIESLAYLVENELFALETPRLHYKYRERLADGLTVAEHATRLREGMLPLAERAGRIFVNSLKSIREMRRDPAPRIAVGNVTQVNVAGVQVNSAQ